MKDGITKGIQIDWQMIRHPEASITLQKLEELNNLGIDWISYQESYFRSLGSFKDIVILVLSTLAKLERKKYLSEQSRSSAGKKKERTWRTKEKN